VRSADQNRTNQKMTTGRVVRYAVLPGILPRVQELFTGSFAYVAFLMGQIYGMVRLLPHGHAYLNPQNIGRFGVRHVMAEAAQNLTWSRKNLDQILIFAAMLMGTVLLLLQVIVLAYSLLVGAAQAADISMLFATPDPTDGEVKDIALLLLFHVFGIPDMFCTVGDKCAETAIGSGVTPFHEGLHDLFQFYSLAVLMVAVLLFLYFVVVVLVETATSGTPFGQRFQNVWVPMRLVIALGLLLPLAHGYSTGQYIALYAAKFGSGMATNGWHAYNQAIVNAGGNNPTGEQETLVGKPTASSLSPVAYAMSLIHACAYAYQRAKGLDPTTPGQDIDTYAVKAYVIKAENNTGGILDELQPALLKDIKYDVYVDTGEDTALKLSNNGDVRIRFGVRDLVRNRDYENGVKPICGEIRIKTHSTKLKEQSSGHPGLGGNSTIDPGARISKFYYSTIQQMWDGSGNTRAKASTHQLLQDMAQRMIEIRLRRSDNRVQDACQYGAGNPHLFSEEDACYTKNPKADIRAAIVTPHQAAYKDILKSAWRQYAANAPFEMDDEIKDRGWGGAGIWYNKIAAMNGTFITVVQDVPELTRYPLIMEETRQETRAANSEVTVEQEFCPYVPEGEQSPSLLQLPGGRGDFDMAQALCEVHQFWLKDGQGDVKSGKALSANPLLNVVNVLLGTTGLFDMRNENAYAHPLAQLVGLGKGFVESSIRNLAGSGVAAFMGGLPKVFGNQGAGFVAGIGGFLKSTAFLGLTAGFILFYVIPFMPFIYVFFAVGGWIKGLFESMVGIPLWAMAHLRLDGEGLPPQAAENGYFLLLDIFIRPILVVFGLIAAITIFATEVRILNFIWDLVLSNAGGFSKNVSSDSVIDFSEFRRSTIDQFFFTIVYAIVVYLMANTAFKLIDAIPKSILRWAGSGISSFGDINEDPKGIERYAAMGGITVGQQLVGGFETAAGGAGGALNTMLSSNDKPAPQGNPNAAGGGRQGGGTPAGGGG